MIGLEKLKSKEKKLNYLEVKYFSIQKKETENEVKETGLENQVGLKETMKFFFVRKFHFIIKSQFFFKFKAITNLSKNM